MLANPAPCNHWDALTLTESTDITMPPHGTNMPSRGTCQHCKNRFDAPNKLDPGEAGQADTIGLSIGPVRLVSCIQPHTDSRSQ